MEGELRTVNAQFDDEKKQKERHERTIEELHQQISKLKKVEKELSTAHQSITTHDERIR